MYNIRIGYYTPIDQSFATKSGFSRELAIKYYYHNKPNAITLENTWRFNSKRSVAYTPRTISVLMAYGKFINQYNNVSIKKINLSQLHDVDVIIINYEDIVFIDLEGWKYLQNKTVYIDDSGELYSKSMLLDEFFDILTANNIYTGNIKIVQNGTLKGEHTTYIDFWKLNHVARTSTITDNIVPLYTSPQISNNFYIEKQKNFLACLGYPRPYRLDLLRFLENNNLTDNFISICHDPHTQQYSFDDSEELSNLKNKYFIEDYSFEYFLSQEPFKTLVYSQSGFTIVPETEYGNKDVLHRITEKSYLPIIYGHPFIVFGNKVSLDHMSKQGFEFFDEIHDHTNLDFDSICASIKDFDKSQLDNYTLSKCLHNHDTLYNKNIIKQDIDYFLHQIS